MYLRYVFFFSHTLSTVQGRFDRVKRSNYYVRHREESRFYVLLFSFDAILATVPSVKRPVYVASIYLCTYVMPKECLNVITTLHTHRRNVHRPGTVAKMASKLNRST